MSIRKGEGQIDIMCHFREMLNHLTGGWSC